MKFWERVARSGQRTQDQFSLHKYITDTTANPVHPVILCMRSPRGEPVNSMHFIKNFRKSNSSNK
jgi:hypothetical protein